VVVWVGSEFAPPAPGHDPLETMTQELYPKLTPVEWLEQRENHMEKHSAWVQNGVVKLANNEDPHYTEVFESREEVERFVVYLLQKADEAWGEYCEASLDLSDQDDVGEEQDEDERHFQACLEQIRKLTHADLVKLMGEEWLEDYCRQFK
jgi:hypothetical protein